MTSYRDNPVFAAFAGDANCLVRQIDIAEIKAGQFGKPEAGRIQELQNCPVAGNDRPVSRNLHKPCHLIGVQVPGQAFG